MAERIYENLIGLLRQPESTQVQFNGTLTPARTYANQDQQRTQGTQFSPNEPIELKIIKGKNVPQQTQGALVLDFDNT